MRFVSLWRPFRPLPTWFSLDLTSRLLSAEFTDLPSTLHPSRIRHAASSPPAAITSHYVMQRVSENYTPPASTPPSTDF